MNDNKTPISLNAPLDINSSNMLVPIAQPKFTYNRQKFLGSLLQTSVRYEDEGWFAGWWKHTFDFVSNRKDYITDANDVKDEDWSNNLVVYKRADEQYGFTYYIVTHKTKGVQLTYTPLAFEQPLNGTLISFGRIDTEDSDDTDAIVTGKTSKDKEFRVIFNVYTGNIVSFDEPLYKEDGTFDKYSTLLGDESEWTCMLLKNNIIYKLTVERSLNAVTDDYIIIRKGQNAILPDDNNSLWYSREAVKSRWGDGYFKLYDKTTTEGEGNNAKTYVANKLYPEDETKFTVTTNIADAVDDNGIKYSTLGKEDELFIGTITDLTRLIVDNIFEYVYKWVAATFASVTPVIDMPNMSNIEERSNTQTAEIIWSKSPTPHYKNRCIYKYALPIWIQHKLMFKYNIQFDYQADPVPLTVKDGVVTYTLTLNKKVYLPPEELKLEWNQFLGMGVDYTVTREHVTVENGINTVYTISVQSLPRYTELVVRLPATMPLEDGFNPIKQVIKTNTSTPTVWDFNPDYDPRRYVVIKDNNNKDQIPYGCGINPDYKIPYAMKLCRKVTDEDGNVSWVEISEFSTYYDVLVCKTVDEMKAISDFELDFITMTDDELAKQQFTSYYNYNTIQGGYNILMGIKNNPSYQPNPYIHYTLNNKIYYTYDPRPVVPACSSVIFANPQNLWYNKVWSDYDNVNIGAITQLNSNLSQNYQLSIKGSTTAVKAYKVDVNRAFVTTPYVSAHDWPVVSDYWSAYWPDRAAPSITPVALKLINPGDYENVTDEVDVVSFVMLPDTSEIDPDEDPIVVGDDDESEDDEENDLDTIPYYVYQPRDAKGNIVPPLTIPEKGNLVVDFTDSEAFSSIHGVINSSTSGYKNTTKIVITQTNELTGAITTFDPQLFVNRYPANNPLWPNTLALNFTGFNEDTPDQPLVISYVPGETETDLSAKYTQVGKPYPVTVNASELIGGKIVEVFKAIPDHGYYTHTHTRTLYNYNNTVLFTDSQSVYNDVYNDDDDRPATFKYSFTVTTTIVPNINVAWQWAILIDREAREVYSYTSGSGSDSRRYTGWRTVHYYKGTEDGNTNSKWRGSKPAVTYKYITDVSTFSTDISNQIIEKRPKKTRHKDTWTLYLRCINVSEQALPIPKESRYFTATIPCSGNFRDGNLDLFSLATAPFDKTVRAPSYTQSPYYDNYKMLNKVSPTDTNIWGYSTTTGIATVNIPLCVPGYTRQLVEVTDNILATGKASFKLSTLLNTNQPIDIATGKVGDTITLEHQEAMFRIDLPLSHYGINLVTPSYESVSGQTTNISQQLRIVYTGTGRPLYMLKKLCAIEDAQTGEITGYNDGVYPKWIDLGIDSYNSQSDICVTYVPADSTMTILTVNAVVNGLNYISNITPSKDYEQNAFNEDAFNKITPAYSISAPIVPTEDQTANQTIKIFPDITDVDINNAANMVIEFKYDPVNGTIGDRELTNTSTAYTIIDTTKGSSSVYPDIESALTVEIQSKKEYVLDFYRTFIFAEHGLMKNVSIIKQDNGFITLNNGYGAIDLASGKLTDATAVSYSSAEENEAGTVLQIYVTENNSFVYYLVPQGIVERNTDNFVYHYSVEEDQGAGEYYKISFIYNTVQLYLYIDQDEADEQAIVYRAKDIRTGETKELYRRDIADLYMFIKQFWSSTVNIENYWWIDDSHVLELSKYDMTLYVKYADDEGTVDDWLGDRWQEVWRLPRSMFITTNDLYYACSNAYETSATFFKLAANGEKIIVLQYITNLLSITATDSKITWQKLNINVATVPLNKTLHVRNGIGAHIPLIAASVICMSRISATRINHVSSTGSPDTYLLIGIAYNKGLAQWTLNIRNNVLTSIVIGYGHVGVNGSLTGGQIPIDHCSNVGLTTVIKPLSDLPSEATTLPKMVVGTESITWFIQHEIKGIVSHMLFNAGAFLPVPLYLNNNYVERYEDASADAQILFDVLPDTINLNTILNTSNSGLAFILAVISPTLFYMNPKYTVIGALNHSLGQYAYVWHNATQQQIKYDGLQKAKDDKGSDKSDKAITFARKTHEVKMSRTGGSNIWLQIIMKSIVGTIDDVASNAINEAQNQSTTDDSSGRKFSQFFADNVTSSISSSLNSKGFSLNLKSELVLKRSLDMFYNISDKTQCDAGPGFVNHTLQAQCLAQSITAIKINGKQIGFFALFAELSIVLEEYKGKLYTAAATVMQNAAVSGQIGSSPGPIINIGQIVAAGLSVAALALKTLASLSEAAVPALRALAKTIGGVDPGDSYVSGTISKYDVNAEGTHAYGNKTMSFFWPAFGITTPNTYTDESVVADYQEHTTSFNLAGRTAFNTQSTANGTIKNSAIAYGKGDIKLINVAPRGAETQQTAPDDMAVIEGTTSFLSKETFKNEQVGVLPPVFPPPAVFDYLIDKDWQLGYTALDGEIISVSCDDTKLMDGPPSNIVISPTFCGIASSYTVQEVKRLYDEKYLRPTIVTPTAIGLNINRINCVHNAKYYHAFDGQVNRIIKWTGGAGMDTELLYQQYLFQINDHFKRSNIFPPSQFFGSFKGPPSIAMWSYEPIANLVQELTSSTGIDNNVPGEQKSLPRFSVPVHFETLSTLPTVIRMLAPYKLHTVEGVTSLTTDIRSTQTRYKAPTSIDFNIDGRLYRATEEFICSVDGKAGALTITDLVAKAGLEFIGATTKEAFFYSEATQLYYSFQGTRDLTKKDILSRFNNVEIGRWDFVNQEVIFKCLLKDEVLVCRLDNGVMGEVWPPNETIYNKRSGFKLFSVAGGLVFQGPKRFAVSRFITLDSMIPDIIKNKSRWRKVNRETEDGWSYSSYNRDYGWKYTYFDKTNVGIDSVAGWTHNPFLLVTSMLGVDDGTDAKYEWSITFAWTDQMDKLYGDNEYTTVNLTAETITQGGVVSCRPTHLYLHKELFTRSPNAGYYTFQFQSGNGIGNRERLFIWSDGYIAIEDIQLAAKSMTTQRTQPVDYHVDIQQLKEL